MARSTEKKFLQMKLVFLEEQEQQLCSRIHEKIEKVLKTGKAWLSESSGDTTRRPFREMSQIIEDTVEFVTQIFSEIEGDSQGTLPQESPVESGPKLSETSGDGSLLPGESQGTLPQKSPAESSAKLSETSGDGCLLPADKHAIKPLESRVKKLETAISAITDNLEMLMARQTNIENGMGDLSVKQSNTEDKWMKQFTQIKDKMTDLRQEEDEFVQQNDRKIQSLEKELQTVRNSQDELKNNLADGAKSKETVQANLDLLQQDMSNVQVDVQKLREEIQKHGEAIETNNDDTVKLRKLTDDLSSLKPKIECLENKCNRPVIGFTAGFREDIELTEGTIVTGYTNVKCNTGGSFNEKTGIFTAPVKGMYGVCLNLWQVQDGHVILVAYKTSTEQSKPESLFSTSTVKAFSSDTAMSVTSLDVGNTIYIEVHKLSGNPGLDQNTKFSCFLLG